VSTPPYDNPQIPTRVGSTSPRVCTPGRPVLAFDELFDHGRLVGAQGVDRCETLRDVVLQEDRRALAFVIAKIGPVLLIADQRRKLGAEAAGNFGRIGQPLVFIGFEPAEAVADDRAAADRVTRIAAGAVERRAKEQKRRARLEFDGKVAGRRRRIERMAAMTAGPDDGRAILACVARERPHHVDQIFRIANDPAPHVLVAVRKLGRRARVERERLREVQLDCVAPGLEHAPRDAKDERVLDDLAGQRRTDKQSPEPLGERAVKAAVAERRLAEIDRKIAVEGSDRPGRNSIGDHAPALLEKKGRPAFDLGGER